MTRQPAHGTDTTALGARFEPVGSTDTEQIFCKPDAKWRRLTPGYLLIIRQGAIRVEVSPPSPGDLASGTPSETASLQVL